MLKSDKSHRKPLPVSAIDGGRRGVVLLHLDYYDVPTHRGVVDWVHKHDWALDASSVHNRELPRLTTVDGILTTVARDGTVDW